DSHAVRGMCVNRARCRLDVEHEQASRREITLDLALQKPQVILRRANLDRNVGRKRKFVTLRFWDACEALFRYERQVGYEFGRRTIDGAGIEAPLGATVTTTFATVMQNAVKGALRHRVRRLRAHFGVR